MPMAGSARMAARWRSIGVHPRLAHMLLRCAAARPVAPGRAAGGAAVGARPAARRRCTRCGHAHAPGDPARRGSARAGRPRHPAARPPGRTCTDAAAGRRRAGGAAEDTSSAGLLLAFAYPTASGAGVAAGEGRYTLANGRGAHFGEAQGLGRQEFIVAVDVDDRDRDARILMAAPLSRADLSTHFAAQLVRGESVEWSTREQAVLARRTVTLGALVLEDKPLAEVPAGGDARGDAARDPRAGDRGARLGPRCPRPAGTHRVRAHGARRRRRQRLAGGQRCGAGRDPSRTGLLPGSMG